MAEQAKRYLFSVEEWRGSLPIQRMTFSERGVYQEMLNQQWLSAERNLPDDPEQVADLIALTPAHAAEVLAAWPVVRRKFVADRRDPTRIYNIKLEHIRRTQREKFKERQETGRRGGKASARKRWTDKDIDLKVSLSSPQPTSSKAEAMPTVRIGKERLGKEGIGLEGKGAPIPSVVLARTVTDDERLGDRARELLESYPVWYAAERHGARLPILGGSLQFQEALTLCRTWDDARLEKLARVVLTTDDDYVSRTDRGWKIFTLKASWADDRLRQWEQANQVTV